MERRYSKIVFETWQPKPDIERAIAAGEYTKTYYLDDHTVGRVDLYDPPEGLCKVSYREVSPPYEELLMEHRRKYPAAMCEFWTPAAPASEGVIVVLTRLYDTSGNLDRQFELHLTHARQTLRQIEIGQAGELLREERPIRDVSGEEIGYVSFDAEGKLIREYRFDDD